MERVIHWKHRLRHAGDGLEMLRLVTDEQWQMLQKPRSIVLSDVAGKHSEVTVDTKPEDFKLITDDPERIAWFKEQFGQTFCIGFDLIDKLEFAIDCGEIEL